MAISGMFLVWL